MAQPASIGNASSESFFIRAFCCGSPILSSGPAIRRSVDPQESNVEPGMFCLPDCAMGTSTTSEPAMLSLTIFAVAAQAATQSPAAEPSAPCGHEPGNAVKREKSEGRPDPAAPAERGED